MKEIENAHIEGMKIEAKQKFDKKAVKLYDEISS